MKLSDCIKMAFSDLNRRKLRTILTSFGIAIGALLVILMSGLGNGIQTISKNQIAQMDTYRIITVTPKEKVSKDVTKDKKIDINTLNKLKSISNVSEVSASISTTATSVTLGNKSEKKVSVSGSNLDFPIFSDADINTVKNNNDKLTKYGTANPIIAGTTLTKSNSDSVLIGSLLLKHLGISDYKSAIGKTISITASFPHIEGIPEKQPLVITAKIAGVVNNAYSLGGYTLVTSDTTAAKIEEYYLGDSNYIADKGYDNVSVECKTMADVNAVNAEITKLGYVTNSEGSYADEMNSMLTILKVLLTAAGVIVLLVASIGVINTMSMSVYEKTKSIGIMKAEGASKKDIRRMFVVQSGSLGFVGSLIGSIIALIAGTIADKLLIAYKVGNLEPGMNIIEIHISTIVFTIIFTIVVAMLAGILPARKAAKLNPVDSLRFE